MTYIRIILYFNMPYTYTRLQLILLLNSSLCIVCCTILQYCLIIDAQSIFDIMSTVNNNNKNIKLNIINNIIHT